MTPHFLRQNLSYLKQSGKLVLGEKLQAYIEEKGQLNVEDLVEIANQVSLSVDRLLFNDLATQEKDKKNIKLLVLDVDGVLTDGGMYLTEHGDEIKRFNAKDGMAIKKCLANDIQVAIISNGSQKKAILHRAKMLGIEKVYVGKDKKLDILNSWLPDFNIGLNEVAYIGDDINDIPVMEKIALSACPSNAATDVLNTVDVVLSKKGGDACVREFIEKYLLSDLMA